MKLILVTKRAETGDVVSFMFRSDAPLTFRRWAIGRLATKVTAPR